MNLSRWTPDHLMLQPMRYVREPDAITVEQSLTTRIRSSDGVTQVVGDYDFSMLRWLLECWAEPKLVGDIVQLGPNALRETPMARAALGILEKHGWLVAFEAGTVVRGAARKETWRVVRGG